jgi:zinc transporter 5/7
MSNSLSSGLSQKLILANLLSVVALEAVKDWLLAADIGIFWVLVRVLVCGSVAALALEVASGRIRKWAKTEVCNDTVHVFMFRL